MRVRLYTKEGCHLCEEAKALLLRLKGEFDVRLEEVDIYQNRRLFRRFRLAIPVVTVWGKTTLFAPITEASLREALSRGRASASSTEPLRTRSRGR